ncbi:PAS domain-containing sensor histidine kinase [Thermodesulfovibrionales bacterium]|nr:PAS domain-containing sensor histidine kinase [Thermodesulfovibrionales bacterium]
MERGQLYNIIIDSLPIGLTMVDKDGITIDWSRTAERITGYSKKDIIGKSHLKILHGTSDKKACPLLRCALHHFECTVEVIVKKKDNGLIAMSVMAFPLFDDDGSFIGGIEVFSDITEVKRAERERKNILSMFAHDMKNPVIAMEGFLLRLISGKAGTLTSTQCQYLQLIMDESSKVKNLLTDFLEFSKFEAQRCDPVLGQFNIEKAICRCIEAAKIEAEKKNLRISVEASVNTSPSISAGAMLVNRVITNLLDNAIRYTPVGGAIIIRLTGNDTNITVQVEDTGGGISEDHLPYIFDAFYRGAKDQKGSGLGLSISKIIVEAHNGMIWVNSTPEKGSIFSFTLPRR